MSSTPSPVMRLPASATSRCLTSGGSDEALDVEPQLDGGRDLVDVLPARAGRAHEPFLELAVFDDDGVGDADHVATGTTKARRHEGATKKNPRRSFASGAARQNAAKARQAQPIRNARPPIGVIAPRIVTPLIAEQVQAAREEHDARDEATSRRSESASRPSAP